MIQYVPNVQLDRSDHNVPPARVDLVFLSVICMVNATTESLDRGHVHAMSMSNSVGWVPSKEKHAKHVSVTISTEIIVERVLI